VGCGLKEQLHAATLTRPLGILQVRNSGSKSEMEQIWMITYIVKGTRSWKVTVIPKENILSRSCEMERKDV
jgi:hypothetical protein